MGCIHQDIFISSHLRFLVIIHSQMVVAIIAIVIARLAFSIRFNESCNDRNGLYDWHVTPLGIYIWGVKLIGG